MNYNIENMVIEKFIMYIFPILIICCFFISCCGIIYFKKQLDENEKKHNKKINSINQGELSKSLMV
tara:strand:- start:34 stop:231 length:198 start_codon:yes stop_codon:yes gene_type:complete